LAVGRVFKARCRTFPSQAPGVSPAAPPRLCPNPQPRSCLKVGTPSRARTDSRSHSCVYAHSTTAVCVLPCALPDVLSPGPVPLRNCTFLSCGQPGSGANGTSHTDSTSQQVPSTLSCRTTPGVGRSSLLPDRSFTPSEPAQPLPSRCVPRCAAVCCTLCAGRGAWHDSQPQPPAATHSYRRLPHLGLARSWVGKVFRALLQSLKAPSLLLDGAFAALC